MKHFIFFLFFVPLFSKAQTTHTVAAKETLYSLARKYNLQPKELADYNNISDQTGLIIGQVIKIPAKGAAVKPKTTPSGSSTIEQNEKKAVVQESGSVPIYHKVEKKETLFHISKLYPNTTIDDIKKWNGLSGDGVTEGANLIVGYQKGKKAEPVTVLPVKEKPVAVEKTVVAEKPAVAEVRSATPKTMEPVKTETNKITGKSFNGGYFKSLYNEQAAKNSNAKEETGTAAIFKSSSGWEDGKYYCLHNTAPAGSIVKITNKSNQRSVYAKVLDVIPDLKQNAGILIRLSNAAADELGAGENNFESVINY